MKFLKLPSLLFSLILASPPPDHGDDIEAVEVKNKCQWTYEDTLCSEEGDPEKCMYGPHEWEKLPHSICTHECDQAQHQSPIDLISAERVVATDGSTAADQPRITFKWNNDGNRWAKDPKDGLSLHASCTDCSLKVIAASATHPVAKEYTLVQVHFHTPSEHTVNGELMDGEMHFVHQHGDEYLVVGVFLRADTDSDPDPLAVDMFGPTGVEYALNGDNDDGGIGFTFAGNHGTPLTGAGKVAAADFMSLFNDGAPLNGGFYQYKGGFTTPPCTEVVEWYVMETPLGVSPRTIAAHQKLNGMDLPNLDAITKHNQVTQDNAPMEDQVPTYCVPGTAHCKASSSRGNNRPTVNGLNQSKLYFSMEAPGVRVSAARRPGVTPYTSLVHVLLLLVH